MGFKTGINAAIDGIPCLRRFKIVDSMTPARAVCSSSGASEVLMAGNTDWRGVANAYGATPAQNPGGFFRFQGSTEDSGYDSGVNGAYVEMVRIYWNTEQADLIYHELFFAGNKALTPDAIVVTDATTPGPVSAMGRTCTIGSSTYNIRRAMLEIMCPPAAYNDSGTDGVTARAAGNYKARFQMDGYFSDYAALPTKGNRESFSIQASDSTNWLLDYLMITEVETEVALADEEGRAVGNACKISGDWTGWDSGTKGKIVTPTGTYLYGSA